MSRTITDERLIELMRDADPVTDPGSPEALDPHEQRLLEQVLASDPGESPGTFLPNPRRRRVVLGVTSTGGVAAAASAAVIILTAGGTPSVAFAGWTSSPTTPASGQVQAAEAECQQQENHALASQTPTLVDTRGPYTLLVYGQSQGGFCRTGPKFAGARVDLFQPPRVPARYWRALPAPPAAGQIRTTSEGADYIDTEEQRYGPQYGPNTIMYRSDIGLVGSEVTGVTFTLRNGEQIQATTENGWYAAWWPAPEGPSTQSYKQSVAISAQITTPNGTSTQQLVPTNTESEAEAGNAEKARGQMRARTQQPAAGSNTAQANAAMAEAEAEGWTAEKFRKDLRARIQQGTHEGHGLQGSKAGE